MKQYFLYKMLKFRLTGMIDKVKQVLFKKLLKIEKKNS